jgi:hypothetical protein
MLFTFNALIKPVLGFNAPVWAPNIKPTNIKRLQAVQNRCLRLATGCHQAASIDHLHSEAQILPVEAHLDMVCTQFLAGAMMRGHPSHDIVQRPPGPRRNKNGRPMKETLASKYMPALEKHLNKDGVIPEISYKRVLKEIHTEAVKKAIAKQSPNPLLQRAPPPISNSEKASSTHSQDNNVSTQVNLLLCSENLSNEDSKSQ